MGRTDLPDVEGGSVLARDEDLGRASGAEAHRRAARAGCGAVGVPLGRAAVRAAGADCASREADRGAPVGPPPWSIVPTMAAKPHTVNATALRPFPSMRRFTNDGARQATAAWRKALRPRPAAAPPPRPSLPASAARSRTPRSP